MPAPRGPIRRPRRPAELLLELELALLLIEAWARLAEIHAIVSTHD